MGGVLDVVMSWRTVQQAIALFRKNALVAWRNRKATALRLVAPFLFLLLALLIDKALRANSSTSDRLTDMKSPTADVIGAIPSCHDDLYIKSNDCTEILYSPNNYITQAIMGNVTSRNGVPIVATAYDSSDSIQAYLMDNTERVIAAVHFVFTGAASPASLEGFLLQTNTTSKSFKGSVQDPNTFVQIPLQSAVHREISRFYLGPSSKAAADNLQWNLGLKTYAHPVIATTSVLSQVLGPFVFAACMFSFVAQIGFLVGEKEMGLRQALRTMGMTDCAYWLSWAGWELLLAFVSGHLITIFGLILQFQLFLKNSYGLLFFLFFLFQLSMSSMAMFVCSFISKSQVAVYLGFGIFLIGWIMQTVVLFGVPYSPDYYKAAKSALTVLFSLCPWCPLAKGFTDLGAATVGDSSPGLRWSERSSYCYNIDNVNDQFDFNPQDQYVSFQCVLSLGSIYKVFVALWLGYLFLAIYFDNILPNESGVRRPLYYFLLPSYWLPGSFSQHRLHEVDDSVGPQASPEALDDDVAAEESKMRTVLQQRTGAGAEKVGQQRDAVEVFGLKKVFPYNPCGTSLGGCFFCCSNDKDERAFWAMKGSWLSISENQLFCLLGPNGAGKSTTINCLTGVLPPSNGEALVYGHAISSPSSMEAIRSMMGVCPQFDVLWGELSGIEHLSIYGHVKGVYWRDVSKQAEELLEKVKLTQAGKQRSSAYSGGMKRRLSVAIALLGDPKIVYLDEPTTGMDPISRRYVWDIIQEAKVGRAIVLTTHSMEEADVLGDKIAIMAKGKLRCLGTSLRLKQKFGSGYQIAVSVVPTINGHLDPGLIAQRSEVVKGFFRQGLGLEPFEEGRVYISYLVPAGQEEALTPFLKSLEAESAGLGLTDIQISMTSLEEVFLNIAKKAELEEARGRYTKPVDVPLPDGTYMSVPLGEEHVMNPKTGELFKIRWGTDESGTLCVLECKRMDAADPGPKPGAGTAAGAVPVAMPAAADVTLPDGTVMRVPLNQRYVMNPVSSTPYEITWGVDAATGAAVVVHCEVYARKPEPPEPAVPSPRRLPPSRGRVEEEEAASPRHPASSRSNRVHPDMQVSPFSLHAGEVPGSVPQSPANGSRR